MRTRSQRARGPHGVDASGSPLPLSAVALPPVEVSAQNCALTDLGGWIERWQDYLLRIEGKAKATCEEYAASVRRMARDLELERVDQLTREAIERHLKRRSFAGLGPSRLAVSIIGIRRFAQYLQIHGQLGTNPAAGIATPRTYSKAMKVLTVLEVRRLLFGEKPGTLPRTRAELVAAAMFCVQYGGALRPAELGPILLTDVEWLDEERTFAVMIRHAKHAKKDVLQRIGVEPSRFLGSFLQLRPELGKGPYLFPMASGLPMSTDTVRRRFAELCATREIEPKGRELVPKILRSSRCTNLLDSGMRMDHAQLFMRHASIETTRKHYAYTSDNQVGRSLAKHDPLSKKKRIDLPMQGVMKAAFAGLLAKGERDD